MALPPTFLAPPALQPWLRGCCSMWPELRAITFSAARRCPSRLGQTPGECLPALIVGLHERPMDPETLATCPNSSQAVPRDQTQLALPSEIILQGRMSMASHRTLNQVHDMLPTRLVSSSGSRKNSSSGAAWASFGSPMMIRAAFR